MNHAMRRQFRPLVHVESLEPRLLLNAHLPQQPGAQVYVWPNFKLIIGAIVGVAYVITHQVKANAPDQIPVQSGQDSYSLSGRTSAGTVRVIGTDTYSSTPINDQTYKDSYSNGDWTLSLRNGSSAQIAYSGSGTSSATNGRYTAIMKGTATAPGGRSYSFVGKLVGNDVTDRARLDFRMVKTANPPPQAIVS